MITTKNGKIMHIPSNPNKFEFDSEVTQVFDDMAKRSIPLYEDSAMVTAELAYKRITKLMEGGEEVNILDIGSSTGSFFGHLWPMLSKKPTSKIKGINPYAIDTSHHMVNELVRRYPQVDACVSTIQEYAKNVDMQFDVINIVHVLQFVPPKHRLSFWRSVAYLAKDGAMIIVGVKEYPRQDFVDTFDRYYRGFRLANGYSNYEIDVKNKALANVMKPEPLGRTYLDMRANNLVVQQEVFRYLHFVTFVAEKV